MKNSRVKKTVNIIKMYQLLLKMEEHFMTKKQIKIEILPHSCLLEFQEVNDIILSYFLPVLQHYLMCQNMKRFISFNSLKDLLLICFTLVKPRGILFSNG